MLTEIKTNYRHYFKDGHDQRQGEYKEWYSNGQISEHGFYVNDELHGEYKMWQSNGTLDSSYFNVNNNIEREVDKLVKDINNITDEERMLIKLTWGIECLPK